MMRGGVNQMLLGLCVCIALHDERGGSNQMLLELCFCSVHGVCMKSDSVVLVAEVLLLGVHVSVPGGQFCGFGVHSCGFGGQFCFGGHLCGFGGHIGLWCLNRCLIGLPGP